MRTLRSYLFILMFAMAIPTSTHAAEKPAIEWLGFAFPPVMIRSGDQTRQGFGDLTEIYIRHYLPEFDHNSVDMPVARYTREMMSREGVCTSNLFRTPEREAAAYFSRPVYVVDTHRIITSNEGMARLQPYITNGRIDLMAALADPGVRMSGLRGRAYSPQISAAVSAHPDQYVEVDSVDSALQMAVRGRVAMSPAFPWQAAWHLRNRDFVALPVAGADDYQVGYVACGKNELGRAVIDRVNELMAQPQHAEAITSFYLEWLPVTARGAYLENRHQILRDAVK